MGQVAQRIKFILSVLIIDFNLNNCVVAASVGALSIKFVPNSWNFDSLATSTTPPRVTPHKGIYRG